ncbi:hypothetical protein SNE40_015132 [Patella caerulea]|uniref:Uncharacterized protein n=1 Tax=Patella caerulea TaxID=87958 RepID=A0AAN8JJA9_PATCE
MPLMHKRAVEMSRVIQTSAFHGKASATVSNSADSEPQPSTSGAGASLGPVGNRKRPVISSDEESDMETETAPSVFPTLSSADDIDAPPSPPPPQLISFEPRSFSSSEDEDDYLFISNKRSRVASIESEEEEASADDNDFVPPTPPPVISTPSPPSAIAPPSPMAPASPPPALVPSSEPSSSYVPVHGRRAFAPFHISAMERVFDWLIRGELQLCQSIIKRLLLLASEGDSEILQPFSSKQMYDRLRILRAKWAKAH